MPPDADYQEKRGVFLSIFLTLVLGLMFHVALMALCGGISLGVLAVVAGVFAVGCLHYFLWGRALVRETTAESEEQRLLDQLPDGDWTPKEQSWHRRF